MIEYRKTAVTYQGDGNTSVFPFSFAVTDANSVRVSIYDKETDASTELTRDYFVDMTAHVVHYPGYAPGEPVDAHAQPPKLPRGRNITIYRVTPINQLVDLGNKYPLPYIEAMADKVTAILQEHDEMLGRAVTSQKGSGITPKELIDSIFHAGEKTDAAMNAAKESAARAAESKTFAKISEDAAREMAEQMNTVLASAADEIKQKLSAEYVPQTQGAEMRTAISNASIAILQRSRIYQVGDIAYHKALPSWVRLECVRAGTTGAPEPTSLATVTKAGQLITDGTAVWIVDDVRDGARVGDIILRPTLRDGYIKANGATVKASEYPRLLAWVQEAGMAVTTEQYAQDCSKYVYDAAQDRLTLPNMTGRVLQGGEQVKSIEAGLPNIKGMHEFHMNALANYGAGAMTSRGANTRDYSLAEAPSSNTFVTLDLDASRSNPIYGSSDTVQPPALSLIAQIKY